jgi:hypothetical protein
MHDGYRRVRELTGSEYFLLEPAGHGNIVRVDPALVIGYVAAQEQHVARTAGREENAPVTGTRRHWTLRFHMQTHVLVLAGESYLVGIRVGTHVLPPLRIDTGALWRKAFKPFVADDAQYLQPLAS